MTQAEALEILKMGHNVYLTGSAGSGKTFLLNKYIELLKEKVIGVGITASTGIAATHMNGLTIHSWSGIGIKDNLSDNDLLALAKKSYLSKRFSRTQVLIIDEASMLHPYFLDLVNKVCCFFKKNDQPFGGMQVVLSGDFFQLPPVNRNGEDANFIDKSIIWSNMDLKVCYLDEQFRHNDKELMQVLNDIRADNTGEHTLEPLRKRYKGTIAGVVYPTKLYTHNMDVDRINNQELSKLTGKAKTYNMEFGGNRKLVEILVNSCLAPEELILKKDALVMFVKNNFNEGYVNGTLGIVDGFNQEGLPIIKICSGEKIVAESTNWTIEEDGRIKAEITQLPLRLAWAITVHKSQGMTLDAAEIDLSKAFVEGMGYVALSRVRSLTGLRLLGLNPLALKVNQDALQIDKWLRDTSVAVALELKALALSEKAQKQKEFLGIMESRKKKKSISTYEETKLLIQQNKSIEEIAKKRDLTKGTVLAHLEKILASGENIDLTHLLNGFPQDRFQKIKIAFIQTNDTKLSPVREILGKDFSYDELRLARLFLSQK